MLEHGDEIHYKSKAAIKDFASILSKEEDMPNSKTLCNGHSKVTKLPDMPNSTSSTIRDSKVINIYGGTVNFTSF